MSALPGSPRRHRTLLLEGERVDDVRGIEGLQWEADVVTNDLGPDNLSKRHVSAIRCTPAVLSLGMGMGAKMAAWLGTALARPALQLSGEIILSDAHARAQSGVQFKDATLTRFTVPALDTSSQEPAALLVELQAGQVSAVQGDGSDTRGRVAASKPWSCSGFRIEIGSLPCAHVLRVEALTWSVSAQANAGGVFREPAHHPGRVAVSDLQLCIASIDFAAWASAAQKWFVDGAHLEGDEMTGRITMLADDGTELAALALSGLGFRRFPTLFPVADDRFVVTLYIEAISFSLEI